MPQKKSNAGGHKAACKRLKSYVAGKTDYENERDALKDMAAVIVSMYELQNNTLPYIVVGFDEVVQALAIIGEYLFGDEEDDFEDAEHKGDGAYKISCPACKASVEITRDALMMNEVVTCPECRAEIGVVTSECGCEDCRKH